MVNAGFEDSRKRFERVERRLDAHESILSFLSDNVSDIKRALGPLTTGLLALDRTVQNLRIRVERLERASRREH
jgi:chromosome segregation ATPase